MIPLRALGGSCFLFFSSLTGMADNHLMTEKANQLYHNQLYKEAAQLYQQLIDDGYQHADLYYNAGNAYYRNGQLGYAIQCYHQSLNLSWKEHTRQNLQLVQQKVNDPLYVKSIAEEMQSPFQLLQRWSLNTWSVLSAICFFVVSATGTMLYFKVIQRKALIIIPLLAYLFTTSTLIYLYYLRFVRYPMVVVKPSIQFKSHKATGRNRLYDGTEIRAIQTLPEGLEVQLPDGEKGIIQRNDALAW